MAIQKGKGKKVVRVDSPPKHFNRKSFHKAATMTFHDNDAIINDDAYFRKPTSPGPAMKRKVKSKHSREICVDQVDGVSEPYKKRVRIASDDMPPPDVDSAIEQTKVPTENSANAVSSIYASGKTRKSPAKLPARAAQIIDSNRLKSLGLNALTQKIGEGLQRRVAKEVSKFDRPVKLKVMTQRDRKQMQS